MVLLLFYLFLKFFKKYISFKQIFRFHKICAIYETVFKSPEKKIILTGAFLCCHFRKKNV